MGPVGAVALLASVALFVVFLVTIRAGHLRFLAGDALGFSALFLLSIFILGSVVVQWWMPYLAMIVLRERL